MVDAIRLQTLGLYAIAGFVALAALVFAGQAVARQVRREWSDAMTLDAVGMTRPGMVGAAALRAAGFTAVAVSVAFIVATAMSPLGPVGIGRAAEPDPGVHLDWVASAVALPIIAACLFASAIIPVATVRRRMNPDRGLTATSRLAFSLPATGTAGRALSRARAAGGLTLGSAVIGAAIASAAGVAAWTLVSSYDGLRAHPARYGSSWDAKVGNVGNGAQQLDTRERLAAIPGIRAVGIHSAKGIGDDDQATLFAAEPFLGDVSFGTITAGRAPTSSNEIALARNTLEKYDVSIGDVVEIAKPFEPGTVFSFDVVGEVVVNDTLSSRPGRGGLVTIAGMQRVGIDDLAPTYVVWVDPGVDRAATLASVQAAFPTTFLEHSTPRSVSNLGLVSNQPALLALLVGVLAAAAMVHALVISVLRGRRQIGVLKTIGFTRRQVVATVAWHAST